MKIKFTTSKYVEIYLFIQKIIKVKGSLLESVPTRHLVDYVSHRVQRFDELHPERPTPNNSSIIDKYTYT